MAIVKSALSIRLRYWACSEGGYLSACSMNGRAATKRISGYLRFNSTTTVAHRRSKPNAIPEMKVLIPLSRYSLSSNSIRWLQIAAFRSGSGLPSGDVRLRLPVKAMVFSLLIMCIIGLILEVLTSSA